ncbi:hypothetical protein ACFLVQ_00145 [Chloroflexota bacterium]
MNYFELLPSTLPSLFASIPGFLAWIVGIVIATLMLKRGGGKAEKLLLTGCSLMFAALLARPFLTALALRLVSEHQGTSFSSVGLVVSLPLGTLDMAGVICLIFAFWIRWRNRDATQ